MAQHDYNIANQSGSAFRADLNNALAAVASQNSGTSEPSTTFAYMLWADTTAGKLKIRNGANNAWIEIGTLASTGLGILNAVPLGTVSAPGISFTGDPNTGIYSPGADQLALTVGGTQRLNITTAALLPTLPIRGADGTAANPAYSFSGDTDTGIYRVGANQLGIATSGTLQVYVDASGNVGVGTSSPTSLAGYKSVTVSSTTGGWVEVTNGTVRGVLQNGSGDVTLETRSAHPLIFGINGTERGRFNANGQFNVNRIGGGGSVNIKSQTNNFISEFYHHSNDASVGSITTSTTATTYGTSSDYRLKTVIGPVVDAGQRIDALRPVEYEWKSDGSRTRGFLAHQFQEVYAGSVSGAKDAVDDEGKPVYQSMQASTSEVIADLVTEIQSLRARVAALEA